MKFLFNLLHVFPMHLLTSHQNSLILEFHSRCVRLASIDHKLNHIIVRLRIEISTPDNGILGAKILVNIL